MDTRSRVLLCIAGGLELWDCRAGGLASRSALEWGITGFGWLDAVKVQRLPASPPGPDDPLDDPRLKIDCDALLSQPRVLAFSGCRPLSLSLCVGERIPGWKAVHLDAGGCADARQRAGRQCALTSAAVLTRVRGLALPPCLTVAAVLSAGLPAAHQLPGGAPLAAAPGRDRRPRRRRHGVGPAVAGQAGGDGGRHRWRCVASTSSGCAVL
jgi:hypothetical protein